VATPGSVQTLVEASVTSLVKWVESRHAIPSDVVGDFLQSPSYSSARALVSAVDGVVHLYTTTWAHVDAGQAQLLEAILHVELASVSTSGWIGVSHSISKDLSIALAAKTRDWLVDLQSTGRLESRYRIAPLNPGPAAQGPQLPAQALIYLTIAGLDKWTTEHRDASYRQKLGEVQSLLGLRTSELARILQVSGEAIRQWFDGASISPDRWADIDRLDRIAKTLLSFFKAESLPSVVRRKAPGLNHRSPLDLLVSGRDDELISAYETLFKRGVTQ
jgi:hypothetical protein